MREWCGGRRKQRRFGRRFRGASPQGDNSCPRLNDMVVAQPQTDSAGKLGTNERLVSNIR